MGYGNETYLSDDSDEVLEQTLPPLVSDHSCCHIAEDVGTACLDCIQVAGQWGSRDGGLWTKEEGKQ